MKRTLVVLLVLLVVAVVAVADDSPGNDTLFLSPTPLDPIVIEDAVDLMVPCGSFEYSECWEMQPENQQYHEPARASDGDWVLVQGRAEPSTDEVAYYCWGAGALDGYFHFVLYGDKECTTNDVTWLNHSRMSLIRWQDGQWTRFTDYFGTLNYHDCGAFFTWKAESYWFDGLERYTQYPICLSIESLSPSIWNTENWRDNMRLMALEVTNRVWLPIVLR